MALIERLNQIDKTHRACYYFPPYSKCTLSLNKIMVETVDKTYSNNLNFASIILYSTQKCKFQETSRWSKAPAIYFPWVEGQLPSLSRRIWRVLSCLSVRVLRIATIEKRILHPPLGRDFTGRKKKQHVPHGDGLQSYVRSIFARANAATCNYAGANIVTTRHERFHS